MVIIAAFLSFVAFKTVNMGQIKLKSVDMELIDTLYLWLYLPPLLTASTRESKHTNTALPQADEIRRYEEKAQPNLVNGQIVCLCPQQIIS